MIQLNEYTRRAGFGRRVLASLIDSGIIIIASVIGSALFHGSLQQLISDYVPREQRGIDPKILLFWFGILFSFLAFCILFTFVYSFIELFTGNSLGKRFLKLCVVDKEGNPGTQTLWLRRWAVKYSGTLCFVLSFIPGFDFLFVFGLLAWAVVLIGFFMTLGERPALHDLLAGTTVYHCEVLQD